MISHEHKTIFLHVPKCAGTSVERFFGVIPSNWHEPNYDTLMGWSEELGIHLQHATPKQLLEHGLVTKEQWSTYFKFAFVRNSWDRLESSYLWVSKNLKISGEFDDFLQGRGPYEKYMRDNKHLKYRGDHLRSQIDFIQMDGKDCLDFVGSVENLKEDWDYVCRQLGIESVALTRMKHNKKRKKSPYRTNEHIDQVSRLYQQEIDHFGFERPERGSWYKFLPFRF